MHANSRLLFEKYAKRYFHGGMRVLEIGPDKFPSTYRSLVEIESITWDYLDLEDHAGLTHLAINEYRFPMQDASYDLVLSGQVIEHVRKVWVWMQELSRVCKQNGLVVTVNPVSWPYHEAPVDCWRIFPDGMKALYETASLQVMMSECESLEAVNSRRRLPGRSVESQSRRLRLAYRVLGSFGFPVECAYDTITIGRKVSR
jgi:SAM-dependent methyltransferase